jgi:glycosyltransferase involved in cell wall biosynthesis
MRILLVHNSADIYGASRSLARLVARLDRSRFTPMVLLPEDGPLRQMLEKSGCKVFIQPSLRIITRSVIKSPKIIAFLAGFVFSALKTVSLIRREKIDLVHTNTGVIVSSALAARFAGVPHIWHIRDWFQEFGPLWKPYSRYILALSSRVLCVSKPIAGQFPASPKISVLNNGFDLAEFPPVSENERIAARKRFGFTPEDLVVGTVGRIKFIRKGQEFLLRAVALLKERNVRIKCLLAGGVPPLMAAA